MSYPTLFWNLLLVGLVACSTAVQARKDVQAASQNAEADLKTFVQWSEAHQRSLSPPERLAFRARRDKEAEPAIAQMRTCFREVGTHLGRSRSEDRELATQAGTCAATFRSKLMTFMEREGGGVLLSADGGVRPDSGRAPTDGGAR